MAKAKTKLVPWKFVEVVWHDAKSDATWCDEEDLPNTVHIITRGWLVRQTDRAITVAASFNTRGGSNEKPQVGEVITIPNGCVESMRELGVK